MVGVDKVCGSPGERDIDEPLAWGVVPEQALCLCKNDLVSYGADTGVFVRLLDARLSPPKVTVEEPPPCGLIIALLMPFLFPPSSTGSFPFPHHETDSIGERN